MNPKSTKILIIDDEKAIVEVLSASLRDEGFLVDVAFGGRAGLEKIRAFAPDIVLQDIWMPGELDGLQTLEQAKGGGFPDAQFIIMSGHGTIETAVRAVKNGAWDFVEKPLSMDKINILIANILSFKREQSEKNTLLSKLRVGIALIGESPAMVSLKQMIARVATTDSGVLITGETGVGKALVAQNLHYLSHRAGEAFVEINCGATPHELIESELFGHVPGAFTGATQIRRGRVEFALGGTLFLNEIAELPLDAQDKVLALLRDRRFSRVGSSESIEADVRVIAATERNLEDEIKAGRFREDLYSRLNTVPLKVAPLRQRREDILPLVDYFGDSFLRHSGYKRKIFSEAALEHLRGYAWPGNVRELRNFVERVYILTPADEVDVHDLKFAGLTSEPDGAAADGLLTFREARSRFEKEFLIRKIDENQGNISKTARIDRARAQLPAPQDQILRHRGQGVSARAQLNTPIFVALDVDDRARALELIRQTRAFVGGYKVGPRLCLRYGEDFIREVARHGSLFLDNKHFDIPSTMESAVRASFDLGASFCTVHAQAGRDALARLAEVEDELCRTRPFRILAVTILTSFRPGTLAPTQIAAPIAEQVAMLADLTLGAGLSGLVCSPEEVEGLRRRHPTSYLVTPGVRMTSEAKGDQARVADPGRTLQWGSSALVVGRPRLRFTRTRARRQDVL